MCYFEIMGAFVFFGHPVQFAEHAFALAAEAQNADFPFAGEAFREIDFLGFDH